MKLPRILKMFSFRINHRLKINLIQFEAKLQMQLLY